MTTTAHFIAEDKCTVTVMARNRPRHRVVGGQPLIATRYGAAAFRLLPDTETIQGAQAPDIRRPIARQSIAAVSSARHPTLKAETARQLPP
jgi:hypothetical protein